MDTETVEQAALRVLAGRPCPKCLDRGVIYDIGPVRYIENTAFFGSTTGTYTVCDCAKGRVYARA